MDAATLIDPAPTPVAAPLWFVEFFKVLGFALHAVPMNLWYAGVVVAMILYAVRGEHGRRFSGRLMAQMPVVLAYGINLGIVPLLFVQVAYAKVFYPATTLMAWFWLAIIALLIPAYYGVYFYSAALREGGPPMNVLRRAVGWAAALMLIGIGFLFVNGWSLMADVGAWPDLWRGHGSAGTVHGTGLNVGNHAFFPRWLMFFGLALTTTAAWAFVDAAWFARRERPEYRRWATGLAWKLYTVGMVWFAVCGSWYLAHWPAEIRSEMLQWPLMVLTAATALSPGLPLLLLLKAQRQSAGEPSRLAAAIVGLAQFGVLGINAVSRQIVQNLEIGRHFPVLEQATDVQWSPLVAFLAIFVLGLGVVAWMVAQVMKTDSTAGV
jgi:hypothetical protein